MSPSPEQLRLPLVVESTQKITWVIIINFIHKLPHVLLAERLGVPTRSGERTFTFPGGKVIPGEQLRLAAQREVYEETALLIPLESLMSAYKRPLYIHIHGTTLECYGYFALYDEFHNQEPKCNEPEKHGQWQWVELSSLHKLSVYSGLPEIVFLPFWEDVIEEIIENNKFEELRGSSPAWILV